MRRTVAIGRAGLTLLELMVAASLTTILGAAVVVLLGRGLTAWQRAQTRLTQIFQMEKALEKMDEELHNSVAVADRPFEAGAAEFTFATSQTPTRLIQVTYKIVSDDRTGTHTLVRVWKPFPADADSAVQTKTLVPTLRTFSVEYGQLVGADDQKRVEWTRTWDLVKNSGHVPKLLRIGIAMEDPKGGVRSVNREVWVPQGALARPPE